MAPDAPRAGGGSRRAFSLTRRPGTAHSEPGEIPEQRRPLQITMMAERGSSPLWVESDGHVVNTRPGGLDLPEALAADIEAWAEAHERGAEQHDEAFYDRGLELAERIAEALGPRAHVRYFDPRDESLRHL